MDNNAAQAPKKPRGRPRSKTNKQVAEQLREATERLLRDHSHHDLSEREIAAEAGVNDAMIHYYFGNKNGLLFDVIVCNCDATAEKLKALDMIDPASESITCQIVKILIDAVYAKAWITRVLASEITRSNSAIGALFLKRYGPRGLVLPPLQRLFDRLIGCGVYNSRINAKQAALSIFSVITAPLMVSHLSDNFSPTMDEFRQDSWINYVADLLDRQLRATETT